MGYIGLYKVRKVEDVVKLINVFNVYWGSPNETRVKVIWQHTKTVLHEIESLTVYFKRSL